MFMQGTFSGTATDYNELGTWRSLNGDALISTFKAPYVLLRARLQFYHISIKFRPKLRCTCYTIHEAARYEHDEWQKYMTTNKRYDKNINVNGMQACL